MNYYLDVLKKYAQFEGRARRAEYWYFGLFNVIVSIVLGILDSVLGLIIFENTGTIGFIYSLAVLIPGFAVSVRRLHDVGKSGWFSLIVLIPVVGAIWLLVLSVRDGDPGINQYGANPKNPNSPTPNPSDHLIQL